MRGHVFNRGASWYFKVDLGKKADGRRDQLKRGGFRIRRDAEEALDAVLRDVHSSQFVRPTKQTVANFLSEWLPSVAHSLSKRTAEGYHFLAVKYVISRIGELRLTELTHVRLNRLYSELLDSGGHKGRALSPKTVRNVHILLRRALSDAPLPVNPASRARPPRLAGREQTVWDEHTLQAFLRRATSHQDYVVWALLAATGMRRSEALNLRWSDVDFGRASISIQQSKTSAGRRHIPLDGGTVTLLRQHRAAFIGASHVFVTADGGPLNPQAVTERFRACVRRWGFPVIRLHDLRHTHATLLLKEGVHPKVVQERLGHSSIQVTLDVYSHVAVGLQEEAAGRAGQLLWGSVSPAARLTLPPPS